MLQSVKRIEEYVSGMSFEDFCADQKTIDATLRNLGIIGEAVGQVPVSVREMYSEVAWSDIRSFRNVVVHKYWRVDLELLWDVVSNKLPVVKKQLQNIVT